MIHIGPRASGCEAAELQRPKRLTARVGGDPATWSGRLLLLARKRFQGSRLLFPQLRQLGNSQAGRSPGPARRPAAVVSLRAGPNGGAGVGPPGAPGTNSKPKLKEIQAGLNDPNPFSSLKWRLINKLPPTPTGKREKFAASLPATNGKGGSTFLLIIIVLTQLALAILLRARRASIRPTRSIVTRVLIF